MIQPNPAAIVRLDRIIAEINRVSRYDAWWILVWLAEAEPALVERALLARYRAVVSSGPGKGAS
jgi:hypothetical protein